ncbi:hypothetical protein [Metabacillus fastidiosus]|uniref:hypothetical protein n=1 Tax=Metabacillus fastidiosus TaxID=1458 RepID=UPI003D2D7745
MIKVFELQQQSTDITNYQSRVVEYESFEVYLQNVNEKSLPSKENIEVYQKYVDFKKQSITFMFEHNLNGKWVEFVHYAEVVL